MDKKELREWINCFVGISGLILLILGTYFGISELQDININLKNVQADSGFFGRLFVSTNLTVGDADFFKYNETCSGWKNKDNGGLFLSCKD